MLVLVLGSAVAAAAAEAGGFASASPLLDESIFVFMAVRAAVRRVGKKRGKMTGRPCGGLREIEKWPQFLNCVVGIPVT